MENHKKKLKLENIFDGLRRFKKYTKQVFTLVVKYI